MAYNETVVAERSLASDAIYRAWVVAIHNCLTAIGLVQTSDTGQIDTATVTLPATGAYGGYSIWRFSDSEQGTTPIYFKIEFGQGSTATRHSIRITVGTGSNGSGTISNASAAVAMAVSSTPGTGPGMICASFFDGALWFTDYTSNATARVEFIIERVRDTDGAFTGEIAVGTEASTTGKTWTVRTAGAWTAWTGQLLAPTDMRDGGKALLGYISFTTVPRRRLYAVLYAAPSSGGEISYGEEGSIQDGKDSAKFYIRPTPTPMQGESSFSPLVRSA